MGDLLIFTACCGLSAMLGHLRATARLQAEIDRLRARRLAAEVRADNAERELELERMTRPERIAWGTPAVETGLDRLLAEIQAQALADEVTDRVAEANRRSDLAADFQRRAHPSTLPPLPPLPPIDELIIDLRTGVRDEE